MNLKSTPYLDPLIVLIILLDSYKHELFFSNLLHLQNAVSLSLLFGISYVLFNLSECNPESQATVGKGV